MIITVIIIVRCFSYLIFYLNNQTVSQLITQTSFHFLLFLIFSFSDILRNHNNQTMRLEHFTTKSVKGENGYL